MSSLRQDEHRLRTGRRVLSILQSRQRGIPIEGPLPAVKDAQDVFEGLELFASSDGSTRAMLIEAVMGTSKRILFADIGILSEELANALDAEERLLLAEV